MALRDTDVGIIERSWWTVRTGSDYGYGRGEFPDTPAGHRDAVAAAKATIQHFDYGSSGESFSRAWVEKRWKVRWLPAAHEISSGVERAIDTNEIQLSEAEKAALRRGGR